MVKLILVFIICLFPAQRYTQAAGFRGFSLNIKGKICEGPLSIISGMYGIS